jgi:hypothetical protein
VLTRTLKHGWCNVRKYTQLAYLAAICVVLLHFYQDAAVSTVTDIVAAASDCLVHQNIYIQTVDRTVTALLGSFRHSYYCYCIDATIRSTAAC